MKSYEPPSTEKRCCGWLLGVSEELGYLLGVVRSHNRWRGFECVNLIVSENVRSLLAKSLYLSDIMRRYAEGRSGKRFY